MSGGDAAISGRCPVDLDLFTDSRCPCLVDELLGEVRAHPDWARVRSRGPAPTLDDAEVLTMEAVGEFLGLDQDAAIYRYLRREHPGVFPARRASIARPSSGRPPTCGSSRSGCGGCARRVPHDPALSIVDSVPIPVCRFGRAYTCARFRGQAAFGRDTGSKATFYGFRHHLRILGRGCGRRERRPGQRPRPRSGPRTGGGRRGTGAGRPQLLGPRLTAELAPAGIALRAPFKKRATDPDPAGSRVLTRVRWRIETVAAQLVERYQLKRIWARDAWQLTSRVLAQGPQPYPRRLSLSGARTRPSFARLLD